LPLAQLLEREADGIGRRRKKGNRIKANSSPNHE
jgi:hypothetical protein